MQAEQGGDPADGNGLGFHVVQPREACWTQATLAHEFDDSTRAFRRKSIFCFAMPGEPAGLRTTLLGFGAVGCYH